MIRLDPSPLLAPGIVRILGVFPEARFVGGCVRDLLLNRPGSDIDMAGPLSPDVVIARAEANGIKAVPTGIAHGTVTLVADHAPVEMTTLRRDVTTDGRRATVAFTDCWQADAARRDFTMNALSLEADGALHDYFDGVTDARAGIVRFIGDAATRIREDALRILRFYRFSAHFGGGIVDEVGHEACVRHADLLVILSVERVRDELLKLLGAADPLPMLRLMAADGVLARLPVQAAVGDDLVWLVGIESLVQRPDILRRLYRLAGACGEVLRLSNAQIARLKAMNGPDPSALAPDIYRFGRQAVEDRMVLHAMDATTLSVRLADLAGTPDPVLPVTAGDLMKAGMAPGPDLGAALKAIEARWLASGCTLSRAELCDPGNG